MGPKLKVNDLVWLKRPDLLPKGPSKLTNRKLGPFKIIEKTGPVSFKLKLPDTFKCHPVFHISNLEPYSEREFGNGNQQSKIPKLTTDTEGREALKIVGEKKVKGEKFYYILWKGLLPTECTWMKEDEIEDPQLIQDYLNSKK